MRCEHARLIATILGPLLILRAGAFGGSLAIAQERELHSFERRQLTDVYFSEGANAGDIDRDGKPDVVYGPFWFAGPDFKQQHEIYPPKPQPLDFYADNFFNWIYDFNGDGWSDVFVVGFPGTPAYVYENPKADGLKAHWKKHTVFESVSNESPHFVNIVGDERPELICTFQGNFGFATINWEQPFQKWTFHAVSDVSAPERFGHGLGVGDINGDGRQDLLSAAGWFEQPEAKPETSRWRFHGVAFTNAYGGAEMYAYDVDGDGDNDVITSLAAHDFGLAWYEQEPGDGEPVFRQHLIMGGKPEENRYGLVISELHSVALADIDGDGLKDIVTGKTYWSHHKQSPMWDAGAVVYWFRLVRDKESVDFVPYKADGESGIGRQLTVADVNGDKLPDIVVGGMKGCHVLLHSRERVDEERWLKAQPKPVVSSGANNQRGPKAPIDAETGKVRGVLEAETLAITKASAGKAAPQEMAAFVKDRWSGGKQLFWSGGKRGDQLTLELPIAADGEYEISAVFTMASDYGVVQVRFDDEPLGKPLDLFNYPDVLTSGVVTLGRQRLSQGNHLLTLEIAGSNPAAKACFIGLDYLSVAVSDAAKSKESQPGD